MKLNKIIFLISSTVILALIVLWGFDGFELFTRIGEPVEFYNQQTQSVTIEIKERFVMGLDLVILITMGIVGLSFIIISIAKLIRMKQEDNMKNRVDV